MGSFTKTEQIVILLVVLIIIISLGYKFVLKDLLEPANTQLGIVSSLEDDPNIQTNTIELIEESPEIMVHISGQVYSPGLVELVRGDRVKDAVKMAGGLKKEADLDRINLAKKVEDEEKIYIPKIGEDIESELLDEINLALSSQGTNKGSQDKININLASESELDTLPGVGKVIAGRIIDYRSSSPFRTIEELKNVSGIGDKIYEGLKELIIVK